MSDAADTIGHLDRQLYLARQRIAELERERDELRAQLTLNYEGKVTTTATEAARADRNYDAYFEQKKLVATLTEALRSAESTLALMAEGEGDHAEVYQQMSKAELTELRAALAKAGVK